MEQVRTAVIGDVGRLSELVADYHAERTGRRGAGLVRPGDGLGAPPPATEPSVASYVTDPGRVALLGTLDDWVASVALCRVDDGGGERRGVLDVCFVEPGAREVGLGHLLLEHALEWFVASGCTGVDGTAFPGDREAKNFFESAGFKARLLVMHKPLR
jgi:GNAT superfamily N-acetyltransferase